MQLPKLIQPSLNTWPPMHRWPQPLKRFILTLATVACFSAYFFLIGGVIVILAALLLY